MALNEMGLQMDLARATQQENSSADDRARREHEMAQEKSDFQDILETAKGSQESRNELIRNKPELVIKFGKFILENPAIAGNIISRMTQESQNRQSTSFTLPLTPEQRAAQGLPNITPRSAGTEASPITQQAIPPVQRLEQPPQRATPEVAQTPEYKAEIWKLIEDKKKEVSDLIEPWMEQRYGKGFFGKIRRWFGESKYGAVASIGAKIVLGSIGAAGTLGSFVTGPLAAAVLPFAATYGRKYLLEGIGEAALLAKNRGKRSEMTQAIERAKKEFDKGIKEIESGSLTPEAARNKLLVLVANRKNLELDAQSKRMEYYQAESKYKPLIQLASSAGAIGWSLMSGLSLGMQDYDKAVQASDADKYYLNHIAQGGHNVSWDPTQGLKWEEVTQNGIVKHGFEWAKEGPWSGAPWYTLGHGVSNVNYLATYGGLAGAGGGMLIKFVRELGDLKHNRGNLEKEIYDKMVDDVKPTSTPVTPSPEQAAATSTETPAQNTGIKAEIPPSGGPLPIKGSENGPEANIPDLKKDNLKEGKIWKIGTVEIKETDGTILPKDALFRILSIEEDKAVLLLVDKDDKPITSGNKNQLFELDQKVLLENSGINPLTKPEKTAKEKAQEKLEKEEIDEYIKNMKFAKDKYLRTSDKLNSLDNNTVNPKRGDYLITNVDENERCIVLELDLGNNVKSDVRVGFKELFDNKNNILLFVTDKSREVKTPTTGNENVTARADEKYIKAYPEKFPENFKKIVKGQVWSRGGQIFGVLGSNSGEVTIQQIDPISLKPIKPAGGGDVFEFVDITNFLDKYKVIPDTTYSTEPKPKQEGQKQDKQKQGN